MKKKVTKEKESKVLVHGKGQKCGFLVWLKWSRGMPQLLFDSYGMKIDRYGHAIIEDPKFVIRVRKERRKP